MSNDLRILIAPLIFLFLSWFKYFDTASVQVDDNFFTSEFKVLFNYIASFGALIYGFWLFKKYFEKGTVLHNYYHTNILLAIICFFTLPMYSSDIFSILSFGTSEHFNSTIYTDYELKSSNLYYEFVYKMYRTVPCVYGPLNIWISKFCHLSHNSLIINLFCIKFIFLVCHLAFIVLVNLLSKKHPLNLYNWKYIYWIPFFPLFWFQGFMQLHNDILALFFVVAGSFLLFVYHQFIWSFLFFTAAFSIKFNFIIIFGIYLVYWFDLKHKINYAKLFLALFSGIILIIFAYKPFINVWTEVFNPVQIVSQMGTHGSLKDLLGLLGPIIDKKILFKSFDLLLFLFLGALFYYRVKMKIPTTWFQAILIASVFLISLYAHRFFPWYLLFLLFFFYFSFSNSDKWWNWFIFISMAYCLQDLSVQIPHHSALFNLNVGLTTFLGIIAIFLNFRTRFFK